MLAEEQLTVVCEQGPFLDLQRDARRLQLNAVSSLLLTASNLFPSGFLPILSASCLDAFQPVSHSLMAVYALGVRPPCFPTEMATFGSFHARMPPLLPLCGASCLAAAAILGWGAAGAGERTRWRFPSHLWRC